MKRERMMTAAQVALELGVPVRAVYELPIARYATSPRRTRWAESDVLAFKIAARVKPISHSQLKAKCVPVDQRANGGADLLRSFERARGRRTLPPCRCVPANHKAGDIEEQTAGIPEEYPAGASAPVFM